MISSVHRALIFIFAIKIFFVSLKTYDSENYLKSYNNFKPLRNDIVDRKFDKKVFRTKDRPIASGNVTVQQGLLYLSLIHI